MTEKEEENKEEDPRVEKVNQIMGKTFTNVMEAYPDLKLGFSVTYLDEEEENGDNDKPDGEENKGSSKKNGKKNQEND